LPLPFEAAPFPFSLISLPPVSQCYRVSIRCTRSRFDLHFVPAPFARRSAAERRKLLPLPHFLSVKFHTTSNYAKSFSQRINPGAATRHAANHLQTTASNPPEAERP
jgi:hypothetical protein